MSYKIRRYDCGDPDACSVDVATITPVASCGVTHDYSYTDYPPAPVGSWIYTLVVMRSGATRACAIDTVPK